MTKLEQQVLKPVRRAKIVDHVRNMVRSVMALVKREKIAKLTWTVQPVTTVRLISLRNKHAHLVRFGTSK